MKISVALCSYNGGKYIREQLDSLASQTVLPDEIVICDDSSTDNTVEVIESFQSESKIPVRLYRNEQRLGFMKNFQKAILLCKAEYIALCDQDDKWMPEKLAKELAYLESPENAGKELVFTNLLMVDESMKSTGRTLWEYIGFDAPMQKRFETEPMKILLEDGNVVTGSTVLLRSRFASEFVQYLSGNYEILYHDGIIAIVAARRNALGFIPEELVHYRQHGQQVTTIHREILSKDVVRRNVVLYDELLSMNFEPADLRFLGRSILHHRFRSALPSSFTGRLFGVVKEFFSLNYYRYSRSVIMGPVRDLFNRQKNTAV